MKRAAKRNKPRMKAGMKKIEERLTMLERRLLGQMDAQLANVQNTSSSDPSELLDMVSEGEMDYMAAVSAQAGSTTIDEIELALKKLREGTYGICEECGGEIKPRRLEVRPFATLCVRCKERQERYAYGEGARAVSTRSGEVYVNLTEDDVEPPETAPADVLREVEDVEVNEMF
jgi:DnaK suppressor protein